jgi:two-component system response regulator RegA
MTDERPSLLFVDDDDTLRRLMARELAAHGYDVRTAKSVDDAKCVAEGDPPEFAVVDLRMPGASGLELIDALLALDAATRIVILTGWGSVPTAVDAIKRGAVAYLQKPVVLAELLAALTVEAKTPATSAQSAKSAAEALPSLARQEWEYIHRVLDEQDGNISSAARILKTHRRSLQRKLQKHPPTD